MEGREATEEIAFWVIFVTTFAYDFTLYEPPVQDHFVCHFNVDPLSPSTPVHWEPEVAADEPQRFYIVLLVI